MKEDHVPIVTRSCSNSYGKGKGKKKRSGNWEAQTRFHGGKLTKQSH